MKRYLIGAVCALFAMTALAAVGIASWTNATVNTDGSPIPATGPGSLASTTVEWSQCGAGDTFTTRAGAATVPGNILTTPTSDLGVGRWCARAFHTNTYGQSSDTTGVVVKVVDAPKPEKPGNFSFR